MHIAPTHTSGTFETSATATISASGAGITVYGVVVSNKDSSNARSIAFSDTDSTAAAKFTVALAANATVVIEFSWRADKGLKLVASATDADLTYGIFHSSTVT